MTFYDETSAFYELFEFKWSSSDCLWPAPGKYLSCVRSEKWQLCVKWQLHDWTCVVSAGYSCLCWCLNMYDCWWTTSSFHKVTLSQKVSKRLSFHAESCCKLRRLMLTKAGKSCSLSACRDISWISVWMKHFSFSQLINASGFLRSLDASAQ